MSRLRKVLEWKELLEKEARAARLVVEARATELAAEAERLRDERHSFPDEAPGDDVSELVAWARRSALLRRCEDSVRARLVEVRQELEEKRAAHLALRKEVESLRRLEERRAKQERKRRERKAQESIDDAAARRFLPGAGRSFPVPSDATSEPGASEASEPSNGTAFSPSAR